MAISVPHGVLLLANETCTRVSQIRVADTTPVSAIVDGLLASSYEDVEDDGACVVHNANTCQGGLVPSMPTPTISQSIGIYFPGLQRMR